MKSLAAFVLVVLAASSVWPQPAKQPFKGGRYAVQRDSATGLVTSQMDLLALIPDRQPGACKCMTFGMGRQFASDPRLNFCTDETASDRLKLELEVKAPGPGNLYTHIEFIDLEPCLRNVRKDKNPQFPDSVCKV